MLLSLRVQFVIVVPACAVIISDQPLTNFTPLRNASGKEGVIVTQYSMKPLETIGLLKMVPGFRNLTIIENTLINIKEKHGVEIDIDIIPLDDEKLQTTICWFNYRSVSTSPENEILKELVLLD